MGFSASCVALIMRCVTTVSYSIMINGTPSELFHPSRGLRQGDPLFTYLFLFVAEAFSFLIHRAESQSLIHGFKIFRGAPSISHLFFCR